MMAVGKRCIFIFGGGLHRDKSGRWRTNDFNDADAFGVTGDRIRVVAGSYLYHSDPSQTIVVSGGKGQLALVDAPSVAAVMRSELIALGVPAQKIRKESGSNNTFNQVQALQELVTAHAFDHITVISNEYHIPRIKAFIEADAILKKALASSVIKLESGEQIALRFDPAKWKNSITKAYESTAMAQRIAVEQQGVRDIRDGKYIQKMSNNLNNDQPRTVRAMIPVTMDHADLLLTWRNDPVVRHNSWNQDEITQAEHRQWLKRVIDDPNTHAFIILNQNGDSIGTVRFDIKKNEAEINITIGSEFRGYGYGTSSIVHSVRSFLRQKPFLKRILARIKEKNEVSLKAFKKAGFVELKREEGVVYLSIEASPSEV